MKKAVLIIIATLAVLVLAVSLLGEKLGEMLGDAFGSDYTGISRDLYHGNYIKYTLHASGYQMLGQKYDKNDLWYPSDNIYNGGHIITKLLTTLNLPNYNSKLPTKKLNQLILINMFCMLIRCVLRQPLGIPIANCALGKLRVFRLMIRK